MYMYIGIYIYIYMHTYIHTYIYIYIAPFFCFQDDSFLPKMCSVKDEHEMLVVSKRVYILFFLGQLILNPNPILVACAHIHVYIDIYIYMYIYLHVYICIYI